mmetsp:Transcript_29893/g.73526  ORF Transcript_29893/g.73526 Transcript_29893/m.73526 type:complete len:140 (-) Transcript_29893:1696-2115(-)
MLRRSTLGEVHSTTVAFGASSRRACRSGVVELRDRYLNATSHPGKGKKRTDGRGLGAARRAARQEGGGALVAWLHYGRPAGGETVAQAHPDGDPGRRDPLAHGGHKAALESKARLARERGEASRANQQWEFEPKDKREQ